jgi:hypothetical protein
VRGCAVPPARGSHHAPLHLIIRHTLRGCQHCSTHLQAANPRIT